MPKRTNNRICKIKCVGNNNLKIWLIRSLRAVSAVCDHFEYVAWQWTGWNFFCARLVGVLSAMAFSGGDVATAMTPTHYHNACWGELAHFVLRRIGSIPTASTLDHHYLQIIRNRIRSLIPIATCWSRRHCSRCSPRRFLSVRTGRPSFLLECPAFPIGTPTFHCSHSCCSRRRCKLLFITESDTLIAARTSARPEGVYHAQPNERGLSWHSTPARGCIQACQWVARYCSWIRICFFVVAFFVYSSCCYVWTGTQEY